MIGKTAKGHQPSPATMWRATCGILAPLPGSGAASVQKNRVTFMKIFATLLMACCVIATDTSCRGEDAGVVVLTHSVAKADSISLFTYGVESNKIDYLVLEVGKKEIYPHLDGKLVVQNDGNVRGVQFLKLDGMTLRLPSSHRLFVVDQQKCFSMPLTLSLKFVEQSLKDRPQEFSEELQAYLKAAAN
jgi:hypothetical protein